MTGRHAAPKTLDAAMRDIQDAVAAIIADLTPIVTPILDALNRLATRSTR